MNGIQEIQRFVSVLGASLPTGTKGQKKRKTSVLNFPYRLEANSKEEHGCRVMTTNSRDKDGYPLLWFNGKTWRGSRLIYMMVFGDIPKGHYVLHRCDNPLCIEPTHLFCGTCQDNLTDMVLKGRSRFGEKHHNARLTEQEVNEIKLSKECGRVLSLKYNISQGHISEIRSGKKWKKFKAKRPENCFVNKGR